MTTAPYDAIADWYDEYVRTQPLLVDVVIPVVLRLCEATGDLAGQRVCDWACGQGVVARHLARRGAAVVGIDISERLLEIARRVDDPDHPITYRQDDAQVATTLGEAEFDGVVCNMALMDIPDLAATVRAVARVLRPGGWFVCAITHPCVQMPASGWVTRAEGQVVRGSGDYFAEGFWRPGNGPGVRGRVGAQHRMLSTYLNALVQAGLAIERVVEPQGTASLIQQMPGYQHVPVAFIAGCRKGGSA
jgi:ubiquinone/menaquinone biosynthesis C-methylase UbiE